MINFFKEIEKGRLLVSEPFLPDLNFKRSVVFLVEHHEEGSLGFVINQHAPLTLRAALRDDVLPDATVWKGGPVAPETLHWIHMYPELPGSVEIINGVFWGGDFEFLKEGLTKGVLELEKIKFFNGYSGWDSGQLEEELEMESWIVVASNAQIVFNTLKDEHALWRKIMGELGGDFALLANAPDQPWLN